MNELEYYIKGYFEIEDKNLSKVEDLFHFRKLEKGDYHDRLDVNSNYLSFIKSGYFRVYSDHNGREITQWISGPGQLVTDITSFISQLESKWNIQALTECEIYSITRSEYLKIDQHITNWQRLENQFLIKCFSTLEDRVFSLLSMTAQERFLALFEMNSDLFNQVPLQYLASMLGMTPETLSRIRAKHTS